MRIVRQHRPGGSGALVVDEVDRPRPGPGELLVAVEAAGVSRQQVRATLAARGPFPVAPGGEVAGEIAATGPDSGPWQVGDRVVSIAAQGAYADFAVVPATRTSTLPSSVSAVQAVAVHRNGHVALGALRMGCIDIGETVLVTSAAGGVGHIAVQLARQLGAGRVVGAVGDLAQAPFVRGFGADEVVSYAVDAPPWSVTVDLALDGAGGPSVDRVVTSLDRFGRMVTYSAAGGRIELGDLRLQSRSVIGFAAEHLAGRSPERYAQDGEQLWDLVARGGLTGAVHSLLPLADASTAHEIVETRGVLGKVVIEPSRSIAAIPSSLAGPQPKATSPGIVTVV